jgi:hypothetical protein
MLTTGPSGKLCLANTHLSLTELQTLLQFKLALFQFFLLLHLCSCQWRCPLLRRQTRLRHPTPPMWLTLVPATMLPTRTDLLRHLRRCHSCLSVTPAIRSRKRGVVMTRPLNLPPSDSPVACKITHRHVIPQTSATTQGSHYRAFPFLPVQHRMEIFPCPSRKLITYLL